MSLVGFCSPWEIAVKTSMDICILDRLDPIVVEPSFQVINRLFINMKEQETIYIAQCTEIASIAVFVHAGKIKCPLKKVESRDKP